MKAFEGVIGQQRPLAVLGGALDRGAVAPAYLFFGPEGVGKRLAAICFARALLCREAPGEGCGSCPSCRLAEKGGNPDLRVVTPEKRVLKIEQIRGVQDFLSLTPAGGERKVVIIDPAEAMNPESSNALLVTLECPPPGSVVLLITANLGALPGTVLSRCQKLGFRNLAEREVMEVLRAQGLDEQSAAAASLLAEGSPGRALSLESEKWRKVMREAREIAAEVRKGDKGRLLALVESGLESREKGELLLVLFLGWGRRALRALLRGEEGGNPEGENPLFGGLSPEGVEGIVTSLVRAERLQRHNVNVKLLFGNLLLGWAKVHCREEVMG